MVANTWEIERFLRSPRPQTFDADCTYSRGAHTPQVTGRTAFEVNLSRDFRKTRDEIISQSYAERPSFRSHHRQQATKICMTRNMYLMWYA